MSMTDQPTEPRSPVTRRDIVEKGLDAFDTTQFDGTVQPQAAPGAIGRIPIKDVIDLAKIMSAGTDGVPEHCRANPAICVRIVYQAILGQFDPFGVAEQSYVVNHRFNYQSQYIHAVIERRAPLKHRLEVEYTGKIEDGTRAIKVIGTFRDGSQRFYDSPPMKDLKPVRNQEGVLKGSPLWDKDPDQQLFYYGVRAWGRRWCPDILLGVYTDEDRREQDQWTPQDDVPASEASPGLHERLVAAAGQSEEGYRDGHVDRELAQLAPDNQTIEASPEPQPEPQPSPPARNRAPPRSTGRRGQKRTSDRRRAAAPPSPKVVRRAADRAEKGGAKPAVAPRAVQEAADRAEERSVAREAPTAAPAPAAPPEKPPEPRSVSQYIQYAFAWIEAEESLITLGKKWAEERALRNKVGMTSEDRAPLEKAVRDRGELLRAEVERQNANSPRTDS